MPRETIRRASRDGRPAHRQHLALGPPRETSAHATPCRKTPYARRKTRTPRPGGQGVHSEPFGAPVSRAPLEVVRAKQVSNRVGWGSALLESKTPLWRAQNGVPARLERAEHPPRTSGRTTGRTEVADGQHPPWVVSGSWWYGNRRCGARGLEPCTSATATRASESVAVSGITPPGSLETRISACLSESGAKSEAS